MQQAYPDLKCRLMGCDGGQAMQYEQYWRFFDTAISEDGAFQGEDIAFCSRWRKAGGKIW